MLNVKIKKKASSPIKKSEKKRKAGARNDTHETQITEQNAAHINMFDEILSPAKSKVQRFRQRGKNVSYITSNFNTSIGKAIDTFTNSI